MIPPTPMRHDYRGLGRSKYRNVHSQPALFSSYLPVIRSGVLMESGMVKRAAFVFLALVSVALAQSDQLPSTILMKEQGQLVGRDLNSMAKGDAPFDKQQAEAALARLVLT